MIDTSSEHDLIPVILSGGSGSRLWPVSRQSYPKQFCDLLDESLFSKSVKRLQPLASPWTVTVRELKVLTERALTALDVPIEQTVYEPYGRNTGPAIGVLCRLFELKGWQKKVIGVFPADHLLKDEVGFRDSVRRGAKIAAEGQIVTLGIKPTSAATGYGYIETAGEYGKGALQAIGFREKPNEETAQAFLDSGKFYWNSGMFIFRVDRMIELYKQHATDLWSAVATLKEDRSNLAEVYDQMRNVSIDYAIMEKLDSHVCIPCEFGWSDLGSWDSIVDHETNSQARIDAGKLVTVDSQNCYVYPSGDRTYAVVGVDDLLVVDTVDALLIAKKGTSEKVKDVVDRLKSSPNASATQHVFEIRPWGSFEVLRDTPLYKSKAIVIDAGAQISYQTHQKRSEHWVIFKGSGEVTLDGKVSEVVAGSHVYIPAGMKHRIKSHDREPLHFVEVQVGSYFGEDDIIRFEDVYGRK